jgi:repressor LexA
MGKILGQYLKNKRKEKRLASRELSEMSGLSKSFVDYVESGIREPSPDTLKKIADALGESLEYLLTLQMKDSLERTRVEEEQAPYLVVRSEDPVEYKVDKPFSLNSIFSIDLNELIKVPILGLIRAGDPMLADENIIDYSYIERSKANGSRIFGLRVKGDSMNMTGIQDGDIVIVKEQPEVNDGEIGVVLVNGEEATIKKVFKTGSNITLMPQSTNPNHQPQIYDPQKIEIKILGKVIESRKKF